MKILNYNMFLETRSKPISKKEFIELLKNNCKEFLKDPRPKVFRGLGDEENDYLFINPSEHKRRSANTLNIYTLFIDNSDRWIGYPERSKSIICSLNEPRASDYGFHYVVIPFDGAKFGVCPSDDIWFSFDEINSMDDFVYSLNRLGVSDKNYDDMVSSINKLEKEAIENKGKIKTGIFYNEPHIEKYYEEYLENSISLYDYLDNLLDPNNNGFRISGYSDIKFNNDNEVWTDSKCLLISPRDLMVILNELNQDNQKAKK